MKTPHARGWIVGVAIGVFCSTAGVAWAQVGADGIDWCTVGAPGNRAYDGPDPFNRVTDRGSVNYEFKIGKFEVTTSQWMEFFNAALARPDPLPFAGARWWGTPIIWGATRDSTYTGPGTRFRLSSSIANADMIPVGGVSWRQAAVLCNWLSNGKRADAASFMNGAYDVTTFAPDIAYPTFTDQLAHTPGAAYWIPTLDEWMKAVHYDPNANSGTGRWWQQPNGSDTPLIYGPPPSFGGDGSGQANANFRLPLNGQYQIPLGAYPTVRSPWGLLDAAGAKAEWLESTRVVDSVMTRGVDGSYSGSDSSPIDVVHGWGQEFASDNSTYLGFRLASSVPAPASVLTVPILCGMCVRRKRSRHASDSLG